LIETMSQRIIRSSFIRSSIAVSALVVLTGLVPANEVRAQARSAQTKAPTARAAAPIDLTGYWVSVITEDWRWRMITPAKGDYASIPITAEAMRIADRWDPAKDEAAGEQCKSYGAAGLMRIPGRLHITWQDDNTLRVETDAGTQTRLMYFGLHKAAGKPTWQGDSVAEWETPRGRGAGAAGRGSVNVQDQGQSQPAAASQPKSGNLKVITTHMRPGYLRKNGVPYSADAVLTEYWDVNKARNGEQWLVITTLVDDPKYLQQQYVTSPNFKKEADGSKWNPTPCSARW
jgi:hypothetical protein